MKTLLGRSSITKCPRRSRFVLESLGWILRPWLLVAQARLEACPPTLVEIRYALRVLAEQGCFGR
jgi:hypothetical protein